MAIQAVAWIASVVIQADIFRLRGGSVARKRKSDSAKGGSGHRRSKGLKPINLSVDPDEHTDVRVAAALLGESMAEFARRVVVAEAKRVRRKREESHG